MKKQIFRYIGVLGVIVCLVVYIRQPSFPTPDKLLIFGIFAAMIFSQAVELIKRFSPFIALILVYESFRGIADYLNTNVNFQWMIDADKWLFFSHLPTSVLQDWLWHGQTQWYDFLLYLAYMMHFVFPLVLAVYIWQKLPSKYWTFMWTYTFLMFAGFFTYLLFPAAPPWMASDLGYIEPITRVSSQVWFALGIEDFPSLYNQIAPNPVAAVPSLHAAFAVLFALFVSSLFKTKWRFMAWLYPLLIAFGTVYMGEHYVIDAILGAIYALVAYKLTPIIMKKVQQQIAKIKVGKLQKL